MQVTCPHCQNTLAVNDLGTREDIFCETCGSCFTLGSLDTLSRESLQASLGRFQLQAIVGEGAFGVVYRALDPSLDRLVALKTPRLWSAVNSDQQKRFFREARAAAQLRHPNIVPVFEVGQHGPQPYLVSELVDGITLAEHLTAHSFSIEESVELLITVTMALEHAHQQGVVHRDIKPSNIMLDAELQPHVMDFGLAKRAAEDLDMTAQGQLLGTVAYMSPQQAAGDAYRVDGRSDIYSLGVILYELLTGELPFRGTARMLLHQVMHEDPRPPRAMNDRVPRDLETICMKCLQKEPPQRYETATELLGDLRSFQQGQPIRARPISRAERLLRWCRRKPALASLAAALAIAICAGFAGVSMQWTLAEGQRRRAQAGEAEARRHLEQARNNLYAVHINLAEHAWEDGQIVLLKNLLARQRPEPGQDDLRGFEWRYLNSLARSAESFTLGRHAAEVEHVCVSADFRFFASSSIDGNVKIWDAAQGVEIREIDREASPAIAFHAHKPWLIIGDSQLIAINVDTGITEFTASLPGKAQEIAVASDGSTLAVTVSEEPKVFLIDLATAQVAGTVELAGEFAQRLAFSPDAKRLAAGGRNGVLRQWEMDSLKELPRPYVSEASGVFSLSWSPHDDTLVTGGVDGRIVAWDASSGRRMYTTPPHRGIVYTVAHSSDGRWLASGAADNTIRVQELSSGGDLRVLKGHLSPVKALSFAAGDNRQLISGDAHGAVILWNLDQSVERQLFRASVDYVYQLGFTADSQWLVAACGQPPGDQPGQLLSIDAATALTHQVYQSRTDAVFHLAVSPSGRQVAVANGDLEGRRGSVIVYDAGSGREQWSVDVPGRAVGYLAYAPDDRELAVCTVMNLTDFSQPGEILILDAATGRQLAKLQGEAGYTAAVFFARDHSLLAASGMNRLELWNLDKGRKQRDIPSGPGQINWLDLSPDDSLAAISPVDGANLFQPGEARVIELASGATALTLRGHQGAVYQANFSPDGAIIATAAFDGEARLWDASNGRIRAVLAGHQPSVNAAVFSHDGEWLATISSGQAPSQLRIWDAHSGERVSTIDMTGAAVVAEFARDGKSVFVGVQDGEVSRWAHDGRRLATLQAKAPEPTHSVAITSVAVSADKRWLASGDRDHVIVVRDRGTGQELHRLTGHQAPIRQMVFTADGLNLISCSGGSMLETLAGEIILWDLQSVVIKKTLIRDARGVSSVALTPDENHLLMLSAFQDQNPGNPRLMSLASGEVVTTYPAGALHLLTGAISPDGAWVAAGSAEGALALWDLHSGRLIYERDSVSNRGINSLAFSADGGTIATAGDDGLVKLFQTQTGERLLELTCNAHLNSVAFAPDGQTLAAAGHRDGRGVICLWRAKDLSSDSD